MDRKRKITRYFLLFFSLLSLSSCSLTYSLDEVNGIGIGYSRLEKSAFIADISFAPESDTNIVLPDTYNGIEVKELGGYFGRGVPSPFVINADVRSFFPDVDEYYATDESYLYDETLDWWDEKEVSVYKLHITLPKHLKTIAYTANEIEVAIYEEEGIKTAKILRFVYYFEISSDNPYFYTKEGKLYHSDNTLAEEFIYE